MLPRRTSAPFLEVTTGLTEQIVLLAATVKEDKAEAKLEKEQERREKAQEKLEHQREKKTGRTCARTGEDLQHRPVQSDEWTHHEHLPLHPTHTARCQIFQGDMIM